MEASAPKHLVTVRVDVVSAVRATEGPRRLAVCLRLIQPDGEVRKVVMVSDGGMVEGCCYQLFRVLAVPNEPGNTC